MYKSFRIKNFRCFKDFSIDNLECVNLIAGANNVGKTALLEAIFLHAGGTNIGQTIDLNRFRGNEEFKVNGKVSPDIWAPLFYQYDGQAVIEIEAKDSDGQMRRLRMRFIEPDSTTIQWSQASFEETGFLSTESMRHGLELEQKIGKHCKVFKALMGRDRIEFTRPDAPPFPCHFFVARMRPNPVGEAERYGRLEVESQAHEILNILKIIEPRLKRLAMIVTDGVPTLHGDIGLGRLIPLKFMGDGTERLANFALAIADASGGIVLIDEIENGIHYSIMTDVWLSIAKLARDANVQIFATTHSYECIRVAHQAFEKSEVYDFRLRRLDRIKDSIKAATFDGEMLEAALDARWEVR